MPLYFFNQTFTASMTEIQNARGIMDVLSEMLSAIEPTNKEVSCLPRPHFQNMIYCLNTHNLAIDYWQRCHKLLAFVILAAN